jgi:hypothetical protein
MDLPPLTQARPRLSHSRDMVEMRVVILCEHPFKDAEHRLGMIGDLGCYGVRRATPAG